VITRNVIFGLLFISLLGLGVGFFLLEHYDCGRSIACHNLTTRAFALYYSMSALALIFFILLAVPQAFSAWKKFAIWFIPLAALLFAFYPDSGSGDLFSPHPEQVFRWVSLLYVAISILIIAWSSMLSKSSLQ